MANAPGVPTTNPSATLRVLVAEDESAAATALANLLRREGYEAMVAYDGLQALDMAREQPPDVALLDLGLPGLDGYQLAERLHGERGERRPLLVAVTGRGAALDRACSAAAGIDLHLVKPIEPDQLLGLLRRFRATIRP